jgi:hypothetical protein
MWCLQMDSGLEAWREFGASKKILFYYGICGKIKALIPETV